MLRKLEGHDRGVGCLQFKGDRLMSGAGDNTIKIWNLATGISSIDIYYYYYIVCFFTIYLGLPHILIDPLLLFIFIIIIINIIYYLIGECEQTLSGHSDKVLCLQFEGDRIVSGSKDHTIRVWTTDPNRRENPCQVFI